jgi:hypothetical protein
MVFVRHGSVVINGRKLSAQDSVYFAGPMQMQSADEWSQVWRWEIGQPNAPPGLLQGMGVLSNLRLARVVTTLELVAGHDWLFRLDRVNSAAGRATVITALGFVACIKARSMCRTTHT